jgi:uncharacterized repeat protein (TIGR03803 family)
MLCILRLIAPALFALAAMAPNASAQSESVIYSFTDGANDGAVPANGLTFYNESVFGVTNEGGAFNSYGVLFLLYPDGNGGWQESPVHAFQGSNDGATPSPVIFDGAGNLYGEAVSGGKYGYGLIFEFSPTGNSWMMKVLYNFKGGSDGRFPSGGLAFDTSGNLYGTTAAGGLLNLCQSDPRNAGCGIVFRLSPQPTGVWNESVLYTFLGGEDGYLPQGGLTIDSQGNLYGTTFFYGFTGNGGLGVVFKLSPQGQSRWRYSALHHFVGGQGGQIPFSNLILSAGNLYGTTWQGGLMSACNGLGCGVAYQLSAATKKLSLLHTFTGGADGGNLFSPLTLLNGKLFGTTQIGGDLTLCQGTGGSGGNGCGVVYELAPGSHPAKFRVVYTFENSNNNDGDGPDGRLTFDSAGNLYGETRIGGALGLGTIFALAP